MPKASAFSQAKTALADRRNDPSVCESSPPSDVWRAESGGSKRSFASVTSAGVKNSAERNQQGPRSVHKPENRLESRSHVADKTYLKTISASSASTTSQSTFSQTEDANPLVAENMLLKKKISGLEATIMDMNKRLLDLSNQLSFLKDKNSAPAESVVPFPPPHSVSPNAHSLAAPESSYARSALSHSAVPVQMTDQSVSPQILKAIEDTIARLLPSLLNSLQQNVSFCSR
jgi:hypothetical protein